MNRAKEEREREGEGGGLDKMASKVFIVSSYILGFYSVIILT
jgi:hypothetical protein